MLDVLATNGANLDDFPNLPDEDYNYNDEIPGVNELKNKRVALPKSVKAAKEKFLGMLNTRSEGMLGSASKDNVIDERDSSETYDIKTLKISTSPKPTEAAKQRLEGMLNAISKRRFAHEK